MLLLKWPLVENEKNVCVDSGPYKNELFISAAPYISAYLNMVSQI